MAGARRGRTSLSYWKEREHNEQEVDVGNHIALDPNKPLMVSSLRTGYFSVQHRRSFLNTKFQVRAARPSPNSPTHRSSVARYPDTSCAFITCQRRIQAFTHEKYSRSKLRCTAGTPQAFPTATAYHLRHRLSFGAMKENKPAEPLPYSTEALV
jgi:hypothetical protein